MRTSTFVLLLAVLVGLTFAAWKSLGQGLPDGPTPIVPQPMEPTQAIPRPPAGRSHFPGEPSDTEVTPHMKAMDLAKAKLEADELANLARKVPAQVNQLSSNALPKDLIGELRRIEKLAKQLRKEVEP